MIKMPYIKREQRPELDKPVAELVEIISAMPVEQQDGSVNYAVTTFLKGVYTPPKYFRFNRMMGVLHCIAMEAYRRRVAPYEDLKIEENGDV